MVKLKIFCLLMLLMVVSTIPYLEAASVLTKGAETREASTHFPECLKIEGTECWPKTSGLACPQRINATCQDSRCYCCKVKVQEPLTKKALPVMCKNIQNASCILNSLPFFCPKIINAYCEKPDHYCCDLQMKTNSSRSRSGGPSSIKIQTRSLPQCGHNNDGTCLFKASMIHCPKILNATCEASHYCCDLRHSSALLGKNKPSSLYSCKKAQGSCLSMASALHCPKILKAKCENSLHYCCDVGGNSRGNNLLSLAFPPPPPPPPPPRPICEKISGTCLANASNIHCPKHLKGRCDNNHQYCCDLRPSCSDAFGTCLPNASAIHCPKHIHGACDDNHHYCCDLRPSCQDSQGTCLPNASAIHCPRYLQGTCEDSHHFCCDLRPSCQDSQGTCLPNASAIHCPRYLNGTCEDSHHFCCDLRPSCQDSQGTCLPNASAINCPQYLNGTCEDSHQYCCDLRPSCQQSQGTCLPNASAIHCPQHLHGRCEDSHHYCCDMRLPCNQVHGTCLHNASTIACPRKLDATCQDNFHYCCDFGLSVPVSTKENHEVGPTLPACDKVQGTCISNNSHCYCPMKLNATCEDDNDYCCNLKGPAVTTDNRLKEQPTCDKVEGTCLMKNSSIYCAIKLNATCQNDYDYCCDLGNRIKPKLSTCKDIQGTCIPHHSDILCPNKINGTCQDSNYYCCHLNDKSATERTVQPVKYQPTCEEEKGGTCLFNASKLFCPEKLNADCGNNKMYCCNLHGNPEIHETDVDHMLVKEPRDKTFEISDNVCENTQKGFCLSIHSRIYCPEKLRDSCGDPDLYCCKLH